MKLRDRIILREIIPDSMIRGAIRRQIRDRLDLENKKNQQKINFVETMVSGPLAIFSDKANQQHYEVNSLFYGFVLGAHRKYSAAYWEENLLSDVLSDNFSFSALLDEAEKRMLDLTIARSEIKNGDKILELGCGWGSLTLELAKRFPRSKIVGLTNSESQKLYIENLATERGMSQIQVVKEDINTFDPQETFDRIVSIEMFEHLRNYQLLLHKIAGWLNPQNSQATLFVHIFVHDRFTYPMSLGEDSWMARNFFTGGIFPEFGIFDHFQEDLQVVKSWKVNGRHYGLTAEAWYQNCRKNRKSLKNFFKKHPHFPSLSPSEHYVAWKIFFLSCAVLFSWNQGNEWYVGHYLFRKNK